MRLFLIIPKLSANAMAIFPFILLKKTSDKNNLILLNHEQIHLRQQLEMGIVPFYLAYLFNYVINRIKYKSHYLAYRNMLFEKEAYANESDLNYLKKRKFWAWWSC